MPWIPDNEAINQVIDANIRTAAPNQHGVNTPETVKELFKQYYTEISSQLSVAIEGVDQAVSYHDTVGF